MAKYCNLSRVDCREKKPFFLNFIKGTTTVYNFKLEDVDYNR